MSNPNFDLDEIIQDDMDRDIDDAREALEKFDSDYEKSGQFEKDKETLRKLTNNNENMTEIKNELGNKSHEKLKEYYEAIERYEEEKKEITERVKEIYDAAKSEGFDSKIIKKLLKLSKEDKEKRQTEQYLLETYADSLQLNLFD